MVVGRARNKIEKQKEIERFKLEKETELELKRLQDKERERQFQLSILSQTGNFPTPTSPNDSKFDITRAQRALPKFEENEPDEFFQLFEKVALNLNWPRENWPSLMQSVLVGKGRTKYLSLSVQQCQDYEIVKQEILKAYEVTAEFYHAKFRNCKLEQSMSFTDYSHEVSKLLNKWLSAAEINTYEQLRETLCLEQFLSNIPSDIQMHIKEREIKTLDKAASLAEDYNLIRKIHSTPKTTTKQSPFHNGWSKCTEGYTGNHARGTWKPQGSGQMHSGPNALGSVGTKMQGQGQGSNKVGLGQGPTSGTKGERPLLRCFFCHKPGHIFAKCPERQDTKQSYKTAVVDNPNFSEENESKKTYKIAVAEGTVVGIQPKSNHFKTFQFQGKIAGLESDSGLPVVIQRDTASDQSIILRSAIPNIERYYTGKSVLLAGVGGAVTLPLCKLYMKSDLVTGFIYFAVEDSLAIDNVDILLGNEVSGEKVMPNPIVTTEPVLEQKTLELEEEQPFLFLSCVTTRNKALEKVIGMTENNVSGCSGGNSISLQETDNAQDSEIGLDSLFSGMEEKFNLGKDAPVT